MSLLALRPAGRLGQLLLQFRYPPDEIGQLLKGDDLAFGLAVRLSGITEPLLPLRNVVHHARLRGDGGSVADFQMTGEPDLAGEGDEISEFGAAGDASLGHDQAMFAQGDIVGDLNEVVDFRALPDGSRRSE